MSLLELSVDAMMRSFLFRLAEYDGACSREELPPADRDQANARQKLRRRGYVKFEGGYWRLTDQGRAAVERLRKRQAGACLRSGSTS